MIPTLFKRKCVSLKMRAKRVGAIKDEMCVLGIQETLMLSDKQVSAFGFRNSFFHTRLLP